LDECAAYGGDLLTLLKDMVAIESPSEDKAAVDRMGAYVQAELERLGAQVEVDRQATAGDHIIGRWGSARQPGGILLLCHIDTVHPLGSLAVNPCREQDGLLTGPGAMDMKAGIAIALGTLRILQERGEWPGRPMTALFTSDEEVGSLTSRPLIESLAGAASLALCLEPGLPDGSLKTWRKGVGEFILRVRGRAAHAGADHAEGRNAIEELARQVIAIQAMTNYATGTTLNVGMVRGGTASNVVPDEAVADIDLRVTTPEEAERVSLQLRALRPMLEGTSLEIQGGLNRPPMPRDERMVATFGRACSIAARLGMTLTEGGTGGGSDANFVAPLGVPVLDGLGALGYGQHSEREYVRIDSLAPRAALLAGLLTEW
jgi:glutamate carboxypeptidase